MARLQSDEKVRAKMSNSNASGLLGIMIDLFFHDIRLRNVYTHVHTYAHTYTHTCMHEHIHTHKYLHFLTRQGEILRMQNSPVR